MNAPLLDIWFGPGGLRGCFGAGVALGLQEAIQRGDLQPAQLHIYGSSVGCLNGVYLATGNAHHGLAIYREDIDGLIRLENLLPALAQRVFRHVRPTASSADLHLGRNVLDVDHVFDVMAKRTPNIRQEIAASAIRSHAELHDQLSGRIRHIDLRSAADPLSVIRHALCCFPFYCPRDDRSPLDSGIHGSGFAKLVGHSRRRKLVIVLNHDPFRYGPRNKLADLTCAVLASSPHVSRLYLQRGSRWKRAIAQAQQLTDRVQLVWPQQPLQRHCRAEFERLHEHGRRAAERIFARVTG